jgi:antitoxin component YwqK of YwqJK toxin-antitoxin module
MIRNSLYLIVLSLLLSSCYQKNQEEKAVLTHVQFFDRNGVNETIAKKERLDAVKNIDFLKNQPYEKVVRVFKRDEEGKIYSIITSYHDNGQIFQYLEVVGGRARGIYREWYENSNLRIEAKLMEGVGDLSKEAQTSWIFDGENKVYHENGNLQAELFYEKGKLQGLMRYYDIDGSLLKTIPYQNDKICGEKKTYHKNGGVLFLATYVSDILNGKVFHCGDLQTGFYEEDYNEGKLVTGKYYNFKKELTHEISSGFGVRANYTNGYLASEEEYQEGVVEGVCKFYKKNGSLEQQYTIHEG